MTLLLGLDEITHAKTLEVCLILKYSKSSTLHDLHYHLFSSSSSQSLPSFSFVSSCLHLLFPLPLLFTFFHLPPLLPSRYYLLVYFYPSHQTSTSVSSWWVRERSGQTSCWKLIKHFWKSIRTADGVQDGLFSHISPVFCARPSATTRVPHLIFAVGRKPFAPPHFCSKSRPCGLRTKFLGVEKGSLGCGESNGLSLKFFSEEIIWKVWFLGRAWDSILGWFSTCLWGTW